MWAQCGQELPKTCPRAAQELPSSCPGASWELSRGAQEQMQARTIRQFSERRGTTCPAGQPASQPAPAEGWVKRGGGGRWGRELGRREKGERREGVRTNNSVLGGASRYTCGINDFDKFGADFGRSADRWPPVGGSGGGRVARRAPAERLGDEHASKMCTLSTKVR